MLRARKNIFFKMYVSIIYCPVFTSSAPAVTESQFGHSLRFTRQINAGMERLSNSLEFFEIIQNN